MTQIGHAEYQSMRFGDRNTMEPTPLLYLYSIKSSGQKTHLASMNSNDPKERSWDQTYILVIESGLAWDNLEIISMIFLVLLELEAYKHFHITLPWWSENWPDPTALKLKFLDIRLLGTESFINFLNFHVDPLRAVITSKSQIFLEVGPFDMTWWPNLRGHWAGIFRKDALRIGEKLCKTGGAACRCFFRCLRTIL